VQEFCAQIQTLDGDAVVDADGAQELSNDRGWNACNVEDSMIEGGGAHKPYIAGVREPGVAAQLAQSAVTLAAFEHDVLQETFTSDTQELVDDDFPLAVKNYTQSLASR
jgi:hypothetical protein